ncbi:hypothetical protein CRUP_035318, partial [Coryphaenoides rupestris]
AQPNSNCNSVQRLQLTGSGDRWRTVRVAGQPPSPRTYHTSSAGIRDKLYVFSGGDAGATPISDPKLHVFDTDRRRWVLMKFEGDLPANRLDHSMCVVPWTSEDVDSGESETKHLAFIFGGMDTQGVIHSDCVVTILT